jgi:hypothetical protein
MNFIVPSWIIPVVMVLHFLLALLITLWVIRNKKGLSSLAIIIFVVVSWSIPVFGSVFTILALNAGKKLDKFNHIVR